MSDGVASILTECKRANVQRFIWQSGIGLSDGREFSCPNRFVIHVWRRTFSAAITDRAAAERVTPFSRWRNMAKMSEKEKMDNKRFMAPMKLQVKSVKMISCTCPKHSALGPGHEAKPMAPSWPDED